jgi:hypothetical protein
VETDLHPSYGARLMTRPDPVPSLDSVGIDSINGRRP